MRAYFESGNLLQAEDISPLYTWIRFQNGGLVFEQITLGSKKALYCGWLLTFLFDGFNKFWVVQPGMETEHKI